VRRGPGRRPIKRFGEYEAQRLQRSRAQFIGIALALASHFDDPFGDDLPD
jgi:hypothetical protein